MLLNVVHVNLLYFRIICYAVNLYIHLCTFDFVVFINKVHWVQNKQKVCEIWTLQLSVHSWKLHRAPLLVTDAGAWTTCVCIWTWKVRPSTSVTGGTTNCAMTAWRRPRWTSTTRRRLSWLWLSTRTNSRPTAPDSAPSIASSTNVSALSLVSRWRKTTRKIYECQTWFEGAK